MQVSIEYVIMKTSSFPKVQLHAHADCTQFTPSLALARSASMPVVWTEHESHAVMQAPSSLTIAVAAFCDDKQLRQFTSLQITLPKPAGLLWVALALPDAATEHGEFVSDVQCTSPRHLHLPALDRICRHWGLQCSDFLGSMLSIHSEC